MVMKVLALAGLDGDFQHPHGIIFKKNAVVGRSGSDGGEAREYERVAV